MKLNIQNLGPIADLVGAFLIFITLVYIAVQTRQNQKMLLSTVYQMRNESAKSISLVFQPQLAIILAKVREGKPLTHAETLQYESWMQITLRNFENLHYQNELGLLSQEHWRAMRTTISQNLLTRPGFNGYWVHSKGQYREKFSAWIDESLLALDNVAGHHKQHRGAGSISET